MTISQVVFTGTVNLGTLATAIITLIGVATVYYRLKIEGEATRQKIEQEQHKTRECIHAIPNHPENPLKQENVDNSYPEKF